MKPDRLLHPELVALVARAGHGDVIVLADAGLKIPESRQLIDLAVTCGVPQIRQVLEAVLQDLVVEGAMVAAEFSDWNPEVYRSVAEILPVVPRPRPHEELMEEISERALAFVKTGECSAFASVALVCGVSYYEEAVALKERLDRQRIET